MPNDAAPQMFDLAIPVVAAPMFLVTSPELVLACARENIIGAMPAYNARTTEELNGWLDHIDAELGQMRMAAPGRRIGPHAINLIVHASNPRLDADLDVVVRHRVPVVFASVGNPERVREKVQSYGGRLFADVATVKHAQRAAGSGVDGLVLLCAGAGGNCGWLSPLAFIPEVRRFWNGPLAVAGAIGTGAAIRAVTVLGADLAYVGTRFIATRESLASDAYREMLVHANADDVLLTSEVTGIPANFLRESLERCRFTPEGRQGFDTAKEIAVFKKWKDIWSAGQSVGAVTSVGSVADLVAELFREYHTA